MKMLTLAFLALGLGLNAAAQPPPGREHGERPDRPDRPPPVERWMDHLRERNPEEHERMDRMRREDPEAFAAHLRGRVYNARMAERVRERFPELGEVMARMSPEELEELGQLLRPPQQRGPHSSRRGDDSVRSGPGPGPGQPKHGFQRLRERVRDWKAAPTAESKERIRNEIRAEAERMFDERSEMHLDEVRRIEDQLEKLRTMIKDRDARRTEWIEQFINNALADP
jgi:hypothetical protein